MGPRVLFVFLALAVAACVPDPNIYGPPTGRPGMYGPPPGGPPAPQVAPGDIFFSSVRRFCGNAYPGRVVSADRDDDAMRKQELILDIRTCSNREIRMPFVQGDNRSRTWILTRERGGALWLKHDHRLRNGQPEPVTMYGGVTVSPGAATRQEFPADSYSRKLFKARNRPESAENVWAMEIIPGQIIAYELRRPGRYLRVEFDLRRPLGPQPPPWGGDRKLRGVDS